MGPLDASSGDSPWDRRRGLLVGAAGELSGGRSVTLGESLRTASMESFEHLEMSGKKVSGSFCAKHPEGEFLAKGTGH